jgi:arylsulfatase/arylsulfatase A
MGDCYPMRAIDQGFETALVHRGGGIGQPSDPPGGEGKYTDPILFRNGKAEQMSGYCTDVYYENAMEFIGQSQKQGRPFFVYLPDNCPHGPFHDVPPAEYEMYKQMDLGNHRFPQDQGHKLPERTDEDKRARIFAMITNIDTNVGKLINKLTALQLIDNTIVIFMTDNGPNARRYVAGMRGNKSHVHEGGIRSPFFVHWPAELKAGHRSDRVAAHIDVMPTLLEACSVPPPPSVDFDGRSILAELKGVETDYAPRTIFIQSHRGNQPVLYHHFAARGAKWKLLHASGFGPESFAGQPKFELYNMEQDPLEMRDVAAEHPDVVKRLKAEYEAWFKDVSSTRPDNYAPPRIHVGTPHENPTVLTRQDWRHTQGRPWHRNSHGHWLLYVAHAGDFDIHCRFAPAPSAGVAELRMDGKGIEKQLAANAETCTFSRIRLPQGDARLEIVLTHGGQTRGVHQAEVIRRWAFE